MGMGGNKITGASSLASEDRATRASPEPASGLGHSASVPLRLQTEMFPVERPSPEEIIARAMEHKPVATYALFSGGDGSLAAVHWAMNNVPGCQVAHINTGIGIRRTNEFVHETCAREGWPLTEIKAKEDCGQDYREIVLKHGFPGSTRQSHAFMYARLKERAIRKLVRDAKTHWRDKVMLLTGICHDDSQIRSGYGGSVIDFVGSQMWVNHIYWWGKTARYHYVNEVGIPRNPVACELGMSGECLCGAFADKGELAAVRAVDPDCADYIESLEKEVRAAGHNWGWEEGPPPKRDERTIDMFMPMCVGCLKEGAPA
jgi:3'-phosphoadenosine 5'-phosphosulfate sulfotransferase (PAPS reductase)/FAD synthetase